MKFFFDFIATFKGPESGKQKNRKSGVRTFENLPDFRTGRDVRLSPNLYDFFLFKNISLEEVFLLLSFVKTLIFETLCFLKWCPIFDGQCQHQKNILILLIFFIKSTLCWLTSPKLHHWGHTPKYLRHLFWPLVYWFNKSVSV